MHSISNVVLRHLYHLLDFGTLPSSVYPMSEQFPPTLKPQRRSTPPQQHNRYQHGRRSFESEDTANHGKPSLDLTQRLERKLAEFNASSNVLKRWLLEILSWAISALCMGAVVGIYLHINGHSMGDSASCLNAVNVLGKVASAALIVPTSEALGQLKWNWFHNSKAIWDFEIFDKASRGPWGAALLLYRTKGRSLAALGALLIVLLLATDTFFQQVVTYPDQWAPDEMGSEIPRMIMYDPVYMAEYFGGYETNFVDQNIRPLTMQYFVNNGTQPTQFGNGTRADVPLSCPANNCTWPTYETLGVCSQCVDASNLLDLTCLDTSIDWSANFNGPIDETKYPKGTVCGYFLNTTNSKQVLMSGYVVDSTAGGSGVGEVLLARTLPLTDMIEKTPVLGGSINFKHIRAPILDVLIVSTTNTSINFPSVAPPAAHECVLAWCTKIIRSAYDQGRYHEEVLSTFVNTTNGSWPWESYTVQGGGENITMTMYAEDIIITPPESVREGHEGLVYNQTYRLSNRTASNFIMVFDDYIPSSYTAQSPLGQSLLRYKNFAAGPSLRNLTFNPLLAPNNITRHFERLAASMTNAVRSDATSRDMLRGMAFNKSQFVSVHWEWLIFPFALLLLSFAFLMSTIVKTSKDTATGTWKTSAMPTLIYGLPKEARNKLAASDTWNSGCGQTKKVRIKLLPDLGWRMSGQSLLESPSMPVRRNQPPPGWI